MIGIPCYGGYTEPQPNPIGNIMNMGQGYNMNMGSYYNQNPYNNYNQNIYSGYYNPYLIQQKQKQQEIMRQEEERKQIEITKQTFRLLNKMNGSPYTPEQMEERLKIYDPVEERYSREYIESYNNFERFKRLEEQEQQRQQYNQEVPIVHHDDGIPDDISMYDFLEVAGKLLQDEYYEELARKNRGLNQLYNRDQYNRLLNAGRGSNNYFSEVFKNNGNNNPVNIDDMEITLPPRINDEYSQKKRAFMNALFT